MIKETDNQLNISESLRICVCSRAIQANGRKYLQGMHLCVLALKDAVGTIAVGTILATNCRHEKLNACVHSAKILPHC